MYIMWPSNFESRMQQMEHKLLPARSSVRLNCSSPRGNESSNILDIYSTVCYGYTNCTAVPAQLLGSLKCGEEGKTLDINGNEGRTFQLIALARENTTAEKLVLSGGTCKVNNTKLRFHICDAALNINGNCNWKDCPLPLGLEDGRIRDDMISASSELNKNHTAKDGRISYTTDRRSAWCAGPEFSLGTQYLQVDFNESVLVSAVATQGDATDNNWINRYLVHYSWNGSDWIVATDSEGKVKEFNGNTDGSSVVRHWLKPRFNARYVRFVPILWTGQLCMRVEIYGCKATVFPSVETIMKTLTKEPQTCVKHNCTHIPHSMCFMYSGKRHCKCIQACTSEQAEICGSDGRTYRNECHLKRTACVNKKNVDVLKHGPCPVKLAGKVSTSCDKECLTPPHSHCVIRNETSQTCECTKHCPKMHIPVCGSDEKVYVNYCLLRKTACETNTTIKIIRHGNCTTTKLSAKKKVAKPRCNDESCPPYAKCDDTGTEIQCTCPNCSPHAGKKICGSNGKMYIDSCDLRKHSCKENIMIKEVKHGCAVIHKVASTPARTNKPQTEVKTKKKSINYVETLYISMAFVGGLGVIIAIGMCICHPLMSKKDSGNGEPVDHDYDSDGTESVENV
ncbi:uncharacterized protein LOC141876569 [Acropora palmata]|uniref:uncharacterized protein LOC141876569 n=1 Tax=Acropora palmata TaxID=6131 RepID=UPI003DA11383